MKQIVNYFKSDQKVIKSIFYKNKEGNVHGLFIENFPTGKKSKEIYVNNMRWVIYKGYTNNCSNALSTIRNYNNEGHHHGIQINLNY